MGQGCGPLGTGSWQVESARPVCVIHWGMATKMGSRTAPGPLSRDSSPADLEESPLHSPPPPTEQQTHMHTRMQFKMMTLLLKVNSSLESQAWLAPSPAGREGGGPGSRRGVAERRGALRVDRKGGMACALLCGEFFSSINRGGSICPVFSFHSSQPGLGRPGLKEAQSLWASHQISSHTYHARVWPRSSS